MHKVLERLDLFHDVVDRNFLVLAREADDELEDSESDWLLLELSLPVEAFLLNVGEALLSQLIKVGVRIKGLDF